METSKIPKTQNNENCEQIDYEQRIHDLEMELIVCHHKFKMEELKFERESENIKKKNVLLVHRNKMRSEKEAALFKNKMIVGARR